MESPPMWEEAAYSNLPTLVKNFPKWDSWRGEEFKKKQFHLIGNLDSCGRLAFFLQWKT